MSEMVVRVENTAGSPVQTTLFPAGSTFYGACLSDAAGVVAANNFASLFNPIGSGKRMVLIVASVSSYAVAQSIAADGMTATRITAASGGTDSSAAIVPF